MQFDALKYDYPSSRRVMYARGGMVCTTQPLAAQAELSILRQGGNAVDAAIATAACLTVVEPCSNGIGSDAFALVWLKRDEKLYGLNASGVAPLGLDAQTIRCEYETMPRLGWLSVTVPGAPSAWAALSEKYGRLSFEKLLQPAIAYAKNGYPVSPTIAYAWHRALADFEKNLPEPFLTEWKRVFAPRGREPLAGETVNLPEHAATLEEIAATKAESFYKGAIAKKIDAYSRMTGGIIRMEDLAAYHPLWVEPISTNYRGYTVSEIPPNGHGIIALMALNIYEGFSTTERDTAENIHRQIESMKLAFVDGRHYIADPRSMTAKVEQLLSKEYAARRRALIGSTVLAPQYGDPYCGGTVYLCTADSDGNMVSYIQSNYIGFGSGVVVPGTGVSLQNRGCNFYLDPASDNCIQPGKRPYHTIIPGFLSKDGRAIGPFGVMGGFMQPQGHFQVVTNTIDFHMNPQEALDAPRWQWVGDKNIEIERSFSPSVTEQLIRMGHNVTVVPDGHAMGSGQIIWRTDDGTLMGGTEPRADGCVALY